MDNFKEKLQDFLINKCVGDWSECANCPGGHHIDGACHHPEHPSMQEVEVEQQAIVNPSVSKAFHDIRNTYNSLIFHLDEEMEFSINPVDAINRMYKDLELMAIAERACKACKEA